MDVFAIPRPVQCPAASPCIPLLVLLSRTPIDFPQSAPDPNMTDHPICPSITRSNPSSAAANLIYASDQKPNGPMLGGTRNANHSLNGKPLTKSPDSFWARIVYWLKLEIDRVVSAAACKPATRVYLSGHPRWHLQSCDCF